MTIVKFQRGITTKLYRRTIRFLYFACRLMMLYISMKFHDSGCRYRADTNLPFSCFKGECLDKSYGSCSLHVV